MKKDFKTFICSPASLASLALILALSVMPTRAEANVTASGFGVGVVLGEPSGLSARWWLNPSYDALDFAVAYSFDSYFLVNADYKLHFPSWFRSTLAGRKGVIPYFGLGAGLGVGRGPANTVGDTRVFVGLRLPIGVHWQIQQSPLAVFFEVAPGLGMAPSTSAFVQIGIGLRYFF